MTSFPILSGLILIVCIFGFWFGANWLVDSAVHIARRLGVSQLVIGLTIVAIGTSAPEFAVSISSIFQSAISSDPIFSMSVLSSAGWPSFEPCARHAISFTAMAPW